MKTSSAKAKGRNLCKIIKSILHDWLPLDDKDVVVTPAGVTGLDIQLSAEARKIFPYAVEAKNQEAISIWACWDQCQRNALLEKLKPLLIIKRNRSDVLAVVSINDLMELIYAKSKEIR